MNLQLKNNMETAKIEDNQLQILTVTQTLTELMIEKDIAGINKIVDVDFTLTHITGYVQSKKDWFTEIESEQMKYYSYTEVKTSVSITADKATFVGQNLLDARIWGTRNTWRLQQTMQLEKRNGKWIILKSVATIF
ncbi:nuclear transport factor 2 family protein [Chryseobacterium sp. ERMR1:04]|uniref:nuclear transport factor 2 family protein n=1 Tax=Chryseobacterium sp. ERMR1:04 TaxID=1705393 RepID=UPI001F524D41|nr:nuclear transport factor 2 family protein [Chryseobacterium sp. ERMR1:04]